MAGQIAVLSLPDDMEAPGKDNGKRFQAVVDNIVLGYYWTFDEAVEAVKEVID